MIRNIDIIFLLKLIHLKGRKWILQFRITENTNKVSFTLEMISMIIHPNKVGVYVKDLLHWSLEKWRTREKLQGNLMGRLGRIRYPENFKVFGSLSGGSVFLLSLFGSGVPEYLISF